MKIVIIGQVETERAVVAGHEGEDGEEDEDGVVIVRVGGQDLTAHEVMGVIGRSPVTVAIVALPDKGLAITATGKSEWWDSEWGYSEYTPGSYVRMSVGGHDLVPIFEALNGRRVAVWIANEPVNVIDFSEADVRLGELEREKGRAWETR